MNHSTVNNYCRGYNGTLKEEIKALASQDLLAVPRTVGGTFCCMLALQGFDLATQLDR